MANEADSGAIKYAVLVSGLCGTGVTLAMFFLGAGQIIVSNRAWIKDNPMFLTLFCIVVGWIVCIVLGCLVHLLTTNTALKKKVEGYEAYMRPVAPFTTPIPISNQNPSTIPPAEMDDLGDLAGDGSSHK